MKTAEIFETLNTISPFELQEGWDNSGINVDCKEFDEAKIYLSLDVDSTLVEKLPENSLLITHHPLIFKPIKNFSISEFPSSIITKMVAKNISHIAMHTNFDKSHLNKYVCQEVLGFEPKESEEYILEFEVNKNLHELINYLKNQTKNDHIKYTPSHEYIKTASLVTGSAASMLGEIKTECFITGDVKYHDAMLAKELGITLIDIGHFESEHFFGEILLKELQLRKFSAIITNSDNPFTF